MSNEVEGGSPLTGRASRLSYTLVIATAAAAASLGLTALVGWFAGSRVLASASPDLIPMAPSTAVLFVLHGASLVLLARRSPGPRARLAAGVLGAVGAVAALALLVLSGLGVHPEFEHLGMDITGEIVGGAPIGHVSPVGAACFLLASASFFLVGPGRSGRAWKPVAALGLAGLLLGVSLVFLLAYLYGRPLLYGGTFIPPAANTVFGFVVLGLGLAVLAVRDPEVQRDRAGSVRMFGNLVLVFLLLAAGLVAVGHFYYDRYQRKYRSEVEQRLSAIADLKVGELAQWRRERLGDGETLARNRVFTDLAARALDGDSEAASEIRDWLDGGRFAYGYAWMALLDPLGVERLSVPDAPSREPIRLARDIVESLRSGRVRFLDFHRDRPHGPIHLAVLVPILDAGRTGALAGSVVMAMDPETYLYPLIRRWPTPSRTAETLIARREGNEVVYLNELRFGKGTALALRIPLDDDRVPAVMAARGHEGVVEGRDYRGEPVVAALRAVPDSPWFLVARMDQSEVDEPLRARRWEVVALVVALLAVAGASLGLIWRHRSERFYRERYEAAVALRRSEEALTASEERFRRTLDAMNEGFQIFDAEWRHVYLNEAAAMHGHRKREDLLGRSLFECYPGFETTRQFEAMRACMEDRTPRFLEDEVAYPDGSRAWFALGIHPAPEGISVVSRDITERKWNEARIAHLDSVLRGIRNVNQLITREKDAARLLQAACVRLTETMGYRKTRVALRENGHLRLIGHAGGDPDAFSLLAEAMGRGFVPDCAARALDRSEVVAVGKPRDECGACPLRSHVSGCDTLASRLEYDGSVYGVMSVSVPSEWVDDPEERSLFQELAADLAFALYRIELEKRHGEVEEQYRIAQRLESVGRLAGGVAHDFNNLMSIVLAYTGFVMDSMPGDDPRRADLDEARRAADRAVSLTRQLLAFSRKQVLQVEVVDLNRVVAGIEKMIRRLIGEDIEVRTVLDPDLGLTLADPGQIEQVIMNLVVNARDAMPEGGRLTIETSNVHLDEYYVRRHVAARPGPHVMLAVSDTGCGMDPETTARVFEPFFTTKERGKGTGLGLATVYGIVKQSGGNIWVYSEKGKGTVFKIYLPRVEASGRPTAARPLPAVTPATGSETILVVEDEEAVRKAAARILRAAGYTVIEAANGHEGLEAGGRHGGPIHLVLTDVVMPGMGGREMVERLRAFHPTIRAIYVSGYTDNAIAHQGILDPDVDFVAKPFHADALARRVREVLDREEDTTASRSPDRPSCEEPDGR